MKNPNETPEEKAVRLEKHRKYMDYLLLKFFKKGQSQIFGTEYFDCKVCKASLASDKDAIDHYFAKHHVKKD